MTSRPRPADGPRTPAPAWAIREAGVGDAPRIARFHIGCWREAYPGIVPHSYLARLDVDDHAARWRRRIEDGRRRVAVAEPACTATAGIVGVVSWGESHDPPEPALPSLELSSLYVSRAWWGSGVGTHLLLHAIAVSPAHLWVYEENHRAKGFYAKHGFSPDGARKIDERTGVPECRLVRR